MIPYLLLGVGYSTAACLHLETTVEQPAWRWATGWLYVVALWPLVLAMTVVGMIEVRRHDRQIAAAIRARKN